MLTQEEIFDLRAKLPLRALKILSEGTGVPIDELRQRDFNKCFQFLCFHLIKPEFVGSIVCFVKERSFENEVLLEVRELAEEEYALILEYVRHRVYSAHIEGIGGSDVARYGLDRLLPDDDDRKQF